MSKDEISRIIEQGKFKLSLSENRVKLLKTALRAEIRKAAFIKKRLEWLIAGGDPEICPCCKRKH